MDFHCHICLLDVYQTCFAGKITMVHHDFPYVMNPHVQVDQRVTMVIPPIYAHCTTSFCCLNHVKSPMFLGFLGRTEHVPHFLLLSPGLKTLRTQSKPGFASRAVQIQTAPGLHVLQKISQCPLT